MGDACYDYGVTHAIFNQAAQRSAPTGTLVARAADAVLVRSETGLLARFADRWIYGFMAGLFVATKSPG